VLYAAGEGQKPGDGATAAALALRDAINDVLRSPALRQG
jgi:hypothetical protein